MTQLRTVYGVDFSGARLAGKNAWLATIDVEADGLTLRELKPLEAYAKTAERASVLAWLTRAVAESRNALWGIDAPLGLPVELFDEGTSWTAVLDSLASFDGDAIAFGRQLVERSLSRTGSMHVRRVTDREEKTPFDCYHYRIVHQMFHAMRDVVLPLLGDEHVGVLPFHTEQPSHETLLVEACPSSTLRRLGLPRRGYKQTERGPITPERLAVRRVLLRGLASRISFRPAARTVMRENPGGDAIDAVLAGVGAFDAYGRGDFRLRRASEPRIAREGWVFA
jgi:hypothetical protein